jgi:DNA-binding NtrC family response regulator
MAATNRNLEEALNDGTFRQDLYYRLAVIDIKIPPLREWGDDVLLLAEHFIKTLNNQLGKQFRGMTSEVADLFCNYEWPGNVRELSNAIERAIVLGHGEWITPEFLPDAIKQKAAEPAPGTEQGRNIAAENPLVIASEQTSLDEINLAAVQHVLEKSKGNISETARRLRISRGKLRYLLKKLDTPKAD